MSVDWAVTTRALLGQEMAERLWPEYARFAGVTLACRETLRSRAHSFWLASAFLGRAARDDLALLYGFCRLVDDAADEGSPASGELRVAQVREELLGTARPRPLIEAFRSAATRRGIPLGAALALLDGVESDLGPVRIADDASLIRYCYQVGSTVGLMSSALLHVPPEGLPHAVDLGIAMQLTNIVRDVREDAARDRIYLPLVRLEAQGVAAAALLDGRADPVAVTRVLHDLLSLADSYYRSADAGMRDIPGSHRPGIMVASRVYGGIGRRARRAEHSPLRGRVILPPMEKGWRVAEALAACLTPRILGLGRRLPHDPGLHRALVGWPGTDRGVRGSAAA